MRFIWRFFIVGIVAFIMGVCINQVHPRGIRIQYLTLLFIQPNSGEYQTLSADSVLISMFEQTAEIIDIRPISQFNIDHIPTAKSIPFRDFSSAKIKSSGLNLDRPWILYDFQDKTKQVRYIYNKLIKQHASTYLLDGGFAAWLEARYPLTD